MRNVRRFNLQAVNPATHAASHLEGKPGEASVRARLAGDGPSSARSGIAADGPARQYASRRARSVTVASAGDVRPRGVALASDWHTRACAGPRASAPARPTSPGRDSPRARARGLPGQRPEGDSFAGRKSVARADE